MNFSSTFYTPTRANFTKGPTTRLQTGMLGIKFYKKNTKIRENVEVQDKMSEELFTLTFTVAGFQFAVTIAMILGMGFIHFGRTNKVKSFAPKKLSLNKSIYKAEMDEHQLTAMNGICVLLIDPQNDFCDPKGSLSVMGADADSKRFAKAFSKFGMDKVANIFVTLDTHQTYHIAHALFWVNASGDKSPSPFTTISLNDVQSRKWRARRPEHQQWAETYVAKLEEGKRFSLTIWPDHCLAGTEGHAVYPPIQTVLQDWERKQTKSVNYIMKGNNAFTEHYSAIQAEVEREDDPNTQLNTDLLGKLQQYDRIVVAGQARSHCVNFTVRDIVAHLPKNAKRKVWLCVDACSDVPGFEYAGKTFLEDIKAAGVKLVNTSEAFL